MDVVIGDPPHALQRLVHCVVTISIHHQQYVRTEHFSPHRYALDIVARGMADLYFDAREMVVTESEHLVAELIGGISCKIAARGIGRNAVDTLPPE